MGYSLFGSVWVALLRCDISLQPVADVECIRTTYLCPLSTRSAPGTMLRTAVAVTSMATGAAALLSPLQVSYLCSFVESYADHGTSSIMDLDVFQTADHCAEAQETWVEVGHFGIAGYHAPTTCGLVVLAANDTAHLAEPTGMVMNW